MKQLFLLLLAACIFLVSCSGKKSSKPIYPTNCANSLAGSYTGNDICPSSGPSSYPSTITANTSANITISALFGASDVTAELNCTNNSITIPAQTSNGNFTISGTGTYTANTMIINWNGGYAGTPMSCTTTFTR